MNQLIQICHKTHKSISLPKIRKNPENHPKSRNSNQFSNSFFVRPSFVNHDQHIRTYTYYHSKKFEHSKVSKEAQKAGNNYRIRGQFSSEAGRSSVSNQAPKPIETILEDSYNDTEVQLLPSTPPLWQSGHFLRNDFLIFLSDFLKQKIFEFATRLWAQLVTQSSQSFNKQNEHDILENIKNKIDTKILPESLPSLSQIELFALLTNFNQTGLYHHAFQLWKHYDQQKHHGNPTLKTHIYYYSKAFENPFTNYNDVRNSQMLALAIQLADQVKEYDEMERIFRRLIGIRNPDLNQKTELFNVDFTKIDQIPFHLISYALQAHTLDLMIKNYEKFTNPLIILDYIAIYLKNFVNCLTRNNLQSITTLLKNIQKDLKSNPDKNDKKTLQGYLKHIEEMLLNVEIHLETKYARNKLVVAIHDEPILVRIRKYYQDNKNNQHPGIANALARIKQTSESNFPVAKQIILCCFESPVYFEEPLALIETSIRAFVKANDFNSVRWIYQFAIEHGHTISINCRNSLMLYALLRNDPIMCLELFNDIQVSLGPMAGNAVTFQLLFEAIQKRNDLSAALEIFHFAKEHTFSFSVLKQSFETLLNVLLKQNELDEAILTDLIDEMRVKTPNTFNKIWRKRIVEHLNQKKLVHLIPDEAKTSENSPQQL